MTPKQINQNRLVKIFKDVKRLNSSETRFCFLLGAGASKSSGIPTGWELASQWYEDLVEDLSPKELRNWEEEIQFNADKKGEAYPKLYEKRYESSPQLGYEEFKKLMEDKEPSIGYLILSQILTKERHNFVITTNFDYLIEDAVRMYTRTKPFSAGHEFLADFISSQTERPTIIKVHRDLFLNPFNDDQQTQQLKKEWKKALSPILRNFNLLVIGYGGNDGSLMDYLQAIDPSDRKPIYWCKRPHDNLSEKVTKLLNKDDFTVTISDFDELMYGLHTALEYKVFEKLNEPENHQFVLLAKKRLEKLNDKLKEILERYKKADISKSNSKTAESLFTGPLDYIYKAYNEPDVKKRESLYQKGLIAYPEDQDLLGSYAYFLESEHKNYDKAETYYTRALDKNPENVNNIGDYANFLYYVRGKKDEADTHYRKVLGIDPNNAINLGNYALYLHRENSLDLSEKYYRSSLDIDPNNLINLVNYANFLSTKREKNQEAANLYEKALELYPENVDLFTKYAYFLYEELKDPEAAEKFFQEKVKLFPDNSLLIGDYVSFIISKLKDNDRAERILTEAMKKNPEDDMLMSIYATFLTNVRKDFGTARTLFENAIGIGPDHMYKLSNFAHLLIISEEDFVLAKTYIEKALIVSVGNINFQAELWFYLYAHYPKKRKQAEKELEKLIAQGAKSLDWDLQSHVKIANKNGHPDINKLKEFAKKITKSTPSK